MKKMLKRFINKIYISKFLYLISFFVPGFNRLKKYINILKYAENSRLGKEVIDNNPISIRISPINICNYKCLFCEIHKDNLLYPNRSINTIGMKEIQNMESIIKSAYKLSFYGGSAEPLINKEINDIIIYLKKKYNIKMMVNTNASVLNKKLSETMVKYGFDDVLISYHAGSIKGYKRLMTGNIEKVNNQIKYLSNLKKEKHKKYPIIRFNFALHKDNSNECKDILDNARDFGINNVIINRYYGGRNKLQDKKVSFEFDIKNGNKQLDKIYNYAKNINVSVLPEKPQYWEPANKIKWDNENYDKNCVCYYPWKNIHFNPVLNDKNCFYVGVCNRIELFKFYYDKFNLINQNELNKIWNHVLLQYLRHTANSKNINPICKFCKNKNRAILRNVNAEKYANIRDTAVKKFFIKFNELYNYERINGIHVLSENPHSDIKFKNTLEKLNK